MYDRIKLGYYMQHPAAEYEVVWQWLVAHPHFEPVKLKTTGDLSDISVLWIHAPFVTGQEALSLSPQEIESLQQYLHLGGSLLLTEASTRLLPLLDKAFSCPTIEKIWIEDKGFGRAYGFQSFLGHTIFDALQGGIDCQFRLNDYTAYRAGFFEENVPSEYRFIAVEKKYITLQSEHNLIWDCWGGQILCIGGHTQFSQPNLRIAQLKKLIENALLSFFKPSINNTFWHQNSQHSTDEISKLLIQLKPQPKLPSVVKETDDQRVATDNFFYSLGRRCMVMGQESGGIDEVWVHPFRVFKDIEIALKEATIPLEVETITVSLGKERILRQHHTKKGILTEIIVTDLKQPVWGIQYQWEGAKEVLLSFKLTSDFRLMWPYTHDVLGNLTVTYRAEAKGWEIVATTASFVGWLGSSESPLSETHSETAGSEVFLEATYSLSKTPLSLLLGGTNEGVETLASTLELRTLSQMLAEKEQHLLRVNNQFTQVDFSNGAFNRGFQDACYAIDSCWATTPQLGTGLLAGIGTVVRGWDGNQAVSGRPGYAWYFGRDAVWACFAVLAYGDFESVKEQLLLFCKFQDVSGKIFHELPTSGVVHFDAADSTPLFIILAGKLLRHSGQKTFIHAILPHIRKAYEYLLETDRDQDGWIENTFEGHGWIEGGALYGAHVTLYLAGLWVQVQTEIEYICDALGIASFSVFPAERLQAKLNEQFWNEETQFFNHGMNLDQCFKEDRTIMPSVLMHEKLLAPEKVETMLKSWSSHAFSTDWGVRMLHGASPFYNPRGYHYGSIWPLFTGWVSLAAYKYHDPIQGFLHLQSNILQTQTGALGYLEEVLHGEFFEATGVCSHQCWSASNIVHPLLEGMFGITVDGCKQEITVAPQLPPQWHSITINTIRLGEGSLSLARKETSWSFYLKEIEKASVQFVLFLPLGATNDSVYLDGVQIRPTSSHLTRRGGKMLTFAFQVAMQKSRKLTWQKSRCIELIPPHRALKEGMETEGLTVCSEKYEAETYEIIVEGLSGKTYEVVLVCYGFHLSTLKGATLIEHHEERLKLEVIIPESTDKFNTQKILCYLDTTKY